MVASSRARYLAPLALAATIFGIYLIAHAALATKHAAVHTHVTRHVSAGRPAYAGSTYYTVQPGDSLTRIASKTGIALATLETLNPTVDPNSLQTGQRLRLRR